MPPAATSNRYAKHRAEEQIRKAAASSAERDIGRIPNIKNVRRRRAASKSCAEFFKTYNPLAFYLDWSKSQLNELARMDEVVFHGAMSAIADPRGDGKTTRCRMLVLFAEGNAYRFYTFLIGANEEKATDSLGSVATMIRFLPEFAEDFPEICYPIRRLGGVANRASGQLCEGVSTLITWSRDRIVFPTVPPPKNWPKDWPLRSDGMVPTSGSIIGSAGLTADGIRGSLLTLNTGEMKRPDLVIIDDPQTSESAASKTQNKTRYKLVSADVLGMAGPGKTIAAVMPCTVIERGDMVDLILDRKLNPLWRGERTRLMISMPTNMEAWEDYFKVYAACQQKEPPDISDANALYIERRAILDEGAEASWDQRKLESEVSAIQHAMHLYFRDPRAFWSEYQNEPLPPESTLVAGAIKEADLLEKLNSMRRGVVPRDCTRVVAFIDVGKEILFYCICAFNERFSGAIIDYGCFPDQFSPLVSARSPNPSLSDSFKGASETARIYAGLNVLVSKILDARFEQFDTPEKLSVSKLLIDSGFQSETVFQFVRERTSGGVVLPSKGYSVAARRSPMAEWAKKQGERSGFNWKEYAATSANKGRWVIYDANKWKSMAVDRIKLPMGDRAAISIFGSKQDASAGLHTLLFSHLAAEYPIEVSALGRTVNEWEQREGQENHLFDCFVGCCVAASVAGLQWTPDATPRPKRERPKADFDELQRRAQSMPVL